MCVMSPVTMKGQILTTQTSPNHFVIEECAEVLLPEWFLDLGKKKKKLKSNNNN